MAKKKTAVKAPAIKKAAVKKTVVKKAATKKVAPKKAVRKKAAAPFAFGVAAESGQPTLGCCRIIEGSAVIQRGGISKPVCDAIGGIWTPGDCSN